MWSHLRLDKQAGDRSLGGRRLGQKGRTEPEPKFSPKAPDGGHYYILSSLPAPTLLAPLFWAPQESRVQSGTFA